MNVSKGKKLAKLNSRKAIATSAAFLCLTSINLCFVSGTQAQTLKPYSENRSYWQYKGKPVMLLGGFNGAHNVFVLPDVSNPGSSLTAQMDTLASAGGNVMRCVLDPGYAIKLGLPASHQRKNGKFDLNLYSSGSASYWGKFETLLREASERDMIVQLEVWDRFDWQKENWEYSPFRPANNRNYSTNESGLADSYSTYKETPFAEGVPGDPEYESASRSRRAQYDLVRRYQEKYVSHILSISLRYDNVLYVMNNETESHPAWGRYWMDFIEKKAAEQGKTVYVTDMFDDGWKLKQSENYRQAFAQPSEYTFMDISQNNSMKNTGGPEGHWANILYARNQVSSAIRPINSTKIYGADTFQPASFNLRTETRSGDLAGQNGFWMNLLGGLASARFHRPHWGLGSGSVAQASIRAARKLESRMKFWEIEPRNDLLSRRGTITVDDPRYTFTQEPFRYGEAYLAAKPGEKYALYFTRNGSVDLDLTAYQGSIFELRWIDIDTGNWGTTTSISGGTDVRIRAPGNGAWVAAIVVTSGNTPPPTDPSPHTNVKLEIHRR